jgi:hypothetical protein
MFRNVHVRRWVGLTIVAPLGACASGPSLQTLATPAATTPVDGIPYYLPLASVPLTVVGQPGKASDSGGGGGGAAPAAAAPQAAAAAHAAAAAPAAPPYAVTVTLGQPLYRADPSELHFLAYTHDQWADDTQSIRVDANGLLSAASMTSVDETSAVLQSIAELVGRAASLPLAFSAPAFSGAKQPGAKPVACVLPPFSVTAMLPLAARGVETVQLKQDDPLLKGDPQAKQKLLQRIDVFIDSAPFFDPATAPKAPATAGGVLFRAPAPYRLDITVSPSEEAVRDCGVLGGVTEAYVALPNGGPIFAEDMSRAPAVKNTVGLTIQNGMLTGVDPVHPSEANGYAQIPVAVLKTIVAIPSQLLTLRVQQVQNEGNLASAQSALAKGELDLIQNRQQLAKAAEPAATPAK